MADVEFSFVLHRDEFRRRHVVVPRISFTCSALARSDLPPFLGFCLTFLEYLRAKPQAKWFLEPVPNDPAIAPQYYDIIKHPMDVKTLTMNVYAEKYASLKEFKADFDLIWSNCEAYNGTDSEVGRAGAELRDEMNTIWNVHTKLENREDGLRIIYTASALQKLCKTDFVEIVQKEPAMFLYPKHLRTKKPTIEKRVRIDREKDDRPKFVPPSEDLMKEPMTTKEKYNLALDIDMMPPELLGEVINILAAAWPFKKDELDKPIEIPFNQLENETLRTIEAYVKSAKDKEQNVRRMYQSETIPAEEQLKKLSEEQNRIDERLKEKRPQMASSSLTSENETGKESGDSTMSSSATDSTSESDMSDSDD